MNGCFFLIIPIITGVEFRLLNPTPSLVGENLLILPDNLGPDSIQRCHLTSIGNPILEIRRSYDRLISTMGFLILVRRHLNIESAPDPIREDALAVRSFQTNSNLYRNKQWLLKMKSILQ